MDELFSGHRDSDLASLLDYLDALSLDCPYELLLDYMYLDKDCSDRSQEHIKLEFLTQKGVVHCHWTQYIRNIPITHFA